jgi:hypothetical protein
MTTRTQVTLDPDLQREARRKASKLGISFAEYVRRILANDLGVKPKKAEVSAQFDLGASDTPTDVARDKDRIIGEAVWADYKVKTKRLPRRK